MRWNAMIQWNGINESIRIKSDNRLDETIMDTGNEIENVWYITKLYHMAQV